MASIEINNGSWSVNALSANSLDLSASVVGNRLEITRGTAKIALSDFICSGNLSAGEGGNLNPAMDVQNGIYYLYTDASQLEEEITDNYRAIRIKTPLKNAEDGQSLGRTIAHTDLITIYESGCTTVLTYFETAGYTPFRELYPCRASIVSGSANMSFYGVSRKLTEEPIFLSTGCYVCRDLSEFDIYNPFTTAFFETDAELPEITFVNPAVFDSVIESGSMQIQLSSSSNSLGLVGITDSRHPDFTYHPHSPQPLFSLLLRDLENQSDCMLTSLSGWEKVTREDEKGAVCFRFVRSGVIVYLTAMLDADSNRVTWGADVRLSDSNISVVRFDPPFAGMNIGDNTDVHIFAALGPGNDIPIQGEFTMWHPMIPYPSIGMCMPYFAFYDAVKRHGLYCGCHDPLAEYKLLHADSQNGVCSCGAIIPAKGIDEPQNGFNLSGGIVWQLFDGDWYDATLIYRDFVYQEAAWFTGVLVKEREDVPAWLLNMPVWFRAHCNQESWMENLFKAQEDLGEIPVGLHAYFWHEIPFDKNYPHYKPAREDFRLKVPVLQAHGLKVMPYINGRLWDTHDRGDDDYQFTSAAKRWATKGRNGEVITEQYGSKNSKGEPVSLAAMCPSTALWQEKQSEINDWILNDLGADAVYVDQIAAAPPVVCMDKSHAHRAGGGSWWYEHYYNLIEHLKLQCGKDKCFTTESNAEPFVGHIGGMLVWHWVGGYQVPAFSVIYSRYQPMMGRNYGVLNPENSLGFRVLTAQSLCFGDQPGWVTPEMYLTSPSKDFFKKIANLRWKYRDYFISGFCRRPPRLEGEFGKHEMPFGSDAVISAMWENETKGKLIIIINISDDKRDVIVFPDGAEQFSLQADPLSITIKEM